MILNPTVMGGGIELPELSNPGTEGDLLFGKQLIDAAGNVVMGMMPLVQQATPSISVSSTGLITASATQEAGKVEAGTESATRQLTTQGAQTITPGTANKTIPSGRYLTGTQTIQGDANLVAENIKSGVSIFGVAGKAASWEDFSFTGNGQRYVVLPGVTQMPKRIALAFNPISNFPSAKLDLAFAIIFPSGYGTLPDGTTLYSVSARIEDTSGAMPKYIISSSGVNPATIFSGGLQIFLQSHNFANGVAYNGILAY